MRKFCLKLHRYLAIPFGVFIAILCFTGSVMVFQDEIANHILGVEYSHDVPFFMAVRNLHRFLLMAPAQESGMTVGRVIMAAAAIAMTLILLSGLVLWWPRNTKMLRNRLTLHLHQGWRRFVYDSHVVLGFYALIFLLLMSLSGPTFSLKSYRKAALTMVGKQDQPVNEKLINHNPRHIDFNHHAGVNPAQFFLMGIHTGRWGGLITRIIYFLAAIIGGFLPISGYYLWWKKRTAKRKIQVK